MKRLESLLASVRVTEAQRLNIDRFYLSDVGNIRRAILNVTQETFGTGKEQRDALNEIATAAKVLATAHRAKLAADIASHIQTIESNPKAMEAVLRAEQPRNVRDEGFHIEVTREQVQNLQFDESIKQAWQFISWGPVVQLIDDSMNNRRWSKDPIQRIGSSQRTIVDKIAEARQAMEPRISEARETIAKYVPKVSALSKEAAQKVEESKKTLQQPKASPPKAIAEKHDQAMKAVESVQQSLQDLASVQNLLEQDQAKVARDADRALQAVREAAQQTDAAMQNHQESSDSSDAESQSSAAAAQQAQENLQKVLDQVSNHFEKIESGAVPENHSLAQTKLMMTHKHRTNRQLSNRMTKKMKAPTKKLNSCEN